MVQSALDISRFNAAASLPYELRLEDFRSAMQDVYDFFRDVNAGLVGKGLDRLDETLRPAIVPGVLSDMLTKAPAGFAVVADVELTLLDCVRHMHRTGSIKSLAQIAKDETVDP